MSHHHHHPRDHSSEQKHDYAKANAERFDKESKNQKMIEHGTKLAQLSAPYILKYYNFDKNATKVLDFAAGWGMPLFVVSNAFSSEQSAGLVSKQIIPHAKSILGVDVSQGMVDLYNETGQKGGFEGMRAVRADLKGEDGELDGQKFDVVIVSTTPSEGQMLNQISP